MLEVVVDEYLVQLLEIDEMDEDETEVPEILQQVVLQIQVAEVEVLDK